MSEVTRSSEAIQAGAAARAAQERRTMPSGWWGMVLLIATEFTLFTCLIASYFYLRFQEVQWPPPGIEKPSVTLPLVFTAMLVAATAPMYGAVRAGRSGNVRMAWLLLATAAAIQGTYLGLQIHQFVGDMNSFPPTQSAYASIYFVLVGLHHVHVAVGLALNAWLLLVLLRGLTNYRLIGLRVIALYWYFVAFIAIPVVLTQLSPSL